MALAFAALELVVPPAVTRYVGLLTAKPDSFAGTYVELTDSTYERQPISSWDKADIGGIAEFSNTSALVWDALADDGVTVTHWGLFTALTAGDLLWSADVLSATDVVEPLNVAIGDSVRFSANNLRLRGEP